MSCLASIITIYDLDFVGDDPFENFLATTVEKLIEQ